MAPLPRPIGIDATLTDIATGIGKAAKALVTESRSEIGAVAVKTAKVRLDFEMARVSANARAGVEVGIRTSSILGLGAGTSRQASSSTARSVGSIELEIVAIADVPEPARPTPPKPPGRLVPGRGGTGGGVAGGGGTQDPQAALTRAVAMLESPQASAGLDAATRRKLKTAIAAIKAAMAVRNFQRAASLLEAAAALFPPGHPFHRQDG